MPAVADRDRWLALALLLAALALAYLLLVHPWWTVPLLQADHDIAQSRERELRVRTQLAQAPEIERRLAAASREAERSPGFLPEASAELATAGLVQRLEAVVAQASPGNRSCAITNRSPLAAAADSQRFQRVVVQVRLRCGTPELAAVLHALESGSPRLFVGNFNVLAQRYFSLGQGAGSGGLDISFDLYGYLRPAIAPPAGAAAAAGGSDAR
ncbi:type II secretion system protein GspM [Pseudoxanthomonas sangjuensis]|uniref:type II secretion system protein GspM n=1 Tax=Pseudoxanthomonas sangjuensis TaxID=1503750 RepID=UPI001390C538|nr:type II secretion system protein GspM [Pseudoxanthomonas sangjuensis]KAF1708265.1 general secretion pathway protein GspM [Pseudoxanthomonas sangjuensis]